MTAGQVDGLVWHKLSLLTPIVLGGRVIVILVLLSAEHAATGVGNGVTIYVELAVLAIFLFVGFVKWWVTKWVLDGTTLRIETGLFKRDARQLPLARIQAVDTVRPFLARILGLAELRVRLAGGGKAGGRLAYLSEPVALDLRARLLAGHHGLDLATPEPAEQSVATVPVGQLVAGALLMPATLVALLLVVVIVVLPSISPSAAAATGVTLGLYLFGLARVMFRRVVDQYGFAVGLAPDGIRVKHGLFSTVSETVPLARVQAVRKVEPVFWRPLGWCRLEVDVAGSPGGEQGRGSRRLTKSLLPVGSHELADYLFSTLLGLRQIELSKPPPRVRWKAPLSYHFLAAGRDGTVLAASTGRLNKFTTWVPFQKVQSVRRVQGPVQRALKLATVHVDSAGRRVRVEFRDRDVAEADELFDQIVVQSRAVRRSSDARSRAGGVPVAGEGHLDGRAPSIPPVYEDGAAVLSGTGQPPPPPGASEG